VLFGELRHRLALCYSFNDLLRYVRMDAVSGFGHRAAVKLVNFTLTAFRLTFEDSAYPPGGANGGFNLLYQICGPCSIQLALKLVF
jgi:hypothetical protein